MLAFFERKIKSLPRIGSDSMIEGRGSEYRRFKKTGMPRAGREKTANSKWDPEA